MCGNSASDWNTIATLRRFGGTKTRASPSNTGSSSITMRPALGRTSPATHWSSVVFPDPEGPMIAVMVAALSNAASSLGPRPPSPSTRARTESRGASPGMGPPARELRPEVQPGDREGRHHGDHPRGLCLTVRLHRIVDGERARLREPGEVPGDHEGHAEVAQCARKAERESGEQAVPAEWQHHREKYLERGRTERG